MDGPRSSRYGDHPPDGAVEAARTKRQETAAKRADTGPVRHLSFGRYRVIA
jgi:hypothetical protein